MAMRFCLESDMRWLPSGPITMPATVAAWCVPAAVSQDIAMAAVLPRARLDLRVNRK
jgi:hypothetical protein